MGLNTKQTKIYKKANRHIGAFQACETKDLSRLSEQQIEKIKELKKKHLNVALKLYAELCDDIDQKEDLDLYIKYHKEYLNLVKSAQSKNERFELLGEKYKNIVITEENQQLEVLEKTASKSTVGKASKNSNNRFNFMPKQKEETKTGDEKFEIINHSSKLTTTLTNHDQ